MYRIMAIVFIIICVASINSVGATETTLADSTGREYQITTPEEAVAKALDVTGFDRLKGIDTAAAKLSATLVTMVDSTTPFLADSINGRKVWRVEFKNVILDLKNVSSEISESHPRDFVVYVDPELGGLLKVVSQVAGYDEAVWRKPSAELAEKQLLGHRERYLGFPKEKPPVSFVDALDAVRKNPILAQEIVGLHVMHSHLDKDPRLVWDIHLYGIRTILSIKDPGLPSYQRDHWRVLVDAVTGDFIFAGNTPHPVVEDEEK